MTRATLLDRLRADEAGAGITEFALIAPALLMSVFGLFELSHTVYTSTMLQGAIQQAARSSTIEGARVTEGDIDAEVTRAVRRIVPGATVLFARKAYTNFADVGRAEDFNDLDDNGTCGNGEPFEDANGNGVWDADRGITGNGGARDAVLYEVTVQYDRMFPVAEFIGFDPQVSMQSATVLRNQPFGPQNVPASVGNCA